MRGGVTEANTAALESALADFPNAKAQTREEFVDNQIAPLNNILNILYVLLALSRDRQPLRDREHARPDRLRADAGARDAARDRDDATAGAADDPARERDHGADRRCRSGSCSGSSSAALLIARVDFIEFAVPTTQMIVFAIAAIIVGILAAIFPARRAARLDPLKALQYE